MPIALTVDLRPPFSRPRFLAAATALLEALGRAEHEVTVLLTGDAGLRALNRAYRKKDRATDVLSFSPAPGPRVRGAPRVLGDIAISLETAARQAAEHGHDTFTEVVVLCAHGLLHLCGYDHEESPAEAARMLRRERQLLRALGLERDALTARGETSAPAARRR